LILEVLPLSEFLWKGINPKRSTYRKGVMALWELLVRRSLFVLMILLNWCLILTDRNLRTFSQNLSNRFPAKVDICSIDLNSLRKEQSLLAKMIILEDKFDAPEILAGVDLSYKESNCIVAYVALNFKTLEVLECSAIKHKVVFPYIPTFLAYREGPPILALLENLEKIDAFPDILMINGHGIAHPRFCGCASHIGILANIPTIGIASKFLYGMSSEIPLNEGSYCHVNYRGQRVGVTFLSKKGCKPIIISPGHLITLESCLKIAQQSLGGYKFPEPIRLAHKFAQEGKKSVCNITGSFNAHNGGFSR